MINHISATLSCFQNLTEMTISGNTQNYRFRPLGSLLPPCRPQAANVFNPILMKSPHVVATVLRRAKEKCQRLLVKHWIFIVYAVRCSLLPMETPYYL